MKRFIARFWNLITRAKRVGLTMDQIHRLLANGGYPGSFSAFATYCQQDARSADNYWLQETAVLITQA